MLLCACIHDSRTCNNHDKCRLFGIFHSNLVHKYSRIEHSDIPHSVKSCIAHRNAMTHDYTLGAFAAVLAAWGRHDDQGNYLCDNAQNKNMFPTPLIKCLWLNQQMSCGCVTKYQNKPARLRWKLFDSKRLRRTAMVPSSPLPGGDMRVNSHKSIKSVTTDTVHPCT